MAKRGQTYRHHHVHNVHHHHVSTAYFVTFQVQSGDRMELCVPAENYGLLAEGDCGELIFRGTRFQSFERTSDVFGRME